MFVMSRNRRVVMSMKLDAPRTTGLGSRTRWWNSFKDSARLKASAHSAPAECSCRLTERQRDRDNDSDSDSDIHRDRCCPLMCSLFLARVDGIVDCVMACVHSLAEWTPR